MKSVVIGTRGSALALTQTRWVAAGLHGAHPDVLVAIRTFVTRGDATQASNVPLSSFGQKGIFVTELETALLSGEIDLAVHSMKDMAGVLPPGLTIAAVPVRESPADALAGATLDSLAPGSRVGTGSVRRRALLHDRRPDLALLEIRGNVDTRLRKLDEGQYDAVCLAVSGLRRLGLAGRIAEELDTSWFLPDPGQGALAIEAREGDTRVLDIVEAVNDPVAKITTSAERAFLAAVGGSCQTPIGALATLDGAILTLRAMIAAGDTIRYGEERGPAADAVEIGRRAASSLT
ncbi:MAG: hydroxymethylbilane synthase [Capsulimonadaceae bacterium]